MPNYDDDGFDLGVGEVQAVYRYSPSLRVMGLAALFFGVCAAIGFYAFLKEGNIVLLLCAFGSIGFVVAAFVMAVRGLVRPQRLVIGDRGLRVPESRLHMREIVILYEDLGGAVLYESHSQRFLDLHHPEGSQTLARSMMSHRGFEAIVATVRRMTHFQDIRDAPSVKGVVPRLWLSVQSHFRSLRFALQILTVAVMFSFCGGPMYLVSRLMDTLPGRAPVFVSVAPVGAVVLGVQSLSDDRSSWLNRIYVLIGVIGALLVLSMNVWLLTQWSSAGQRPDRFLLISGAVVGFLCEPIYLLLARRFLMNSSR